MKCIHCEEEFEPKVKFCSPKCRVAHHRGTSPEKKSVELETPKEKIAVLPSATGEVTMTKEDKIEALRKLMTITEKKYEEPEGRGCNTCVYWDEIKKWTCIAPGCVNREDPDEMVLYDDSQDIPQEYVLKPGYEHLRGRK